MLQVYDRVLTSRSNETLTALFLLVIILYSFMGCLEFARGRLMANAGARFQSYLDETVFRSMLKKAVNDKDGLQHSNGLREVESIHALATSPVVIAIFDAPWCPFFVAVIFMLHPILGWLAVFGGLFLCAIAAINQHLAKPQMIKAVKLSTRAQSFAENACKSAALIEAQGMQTAIVDKWKQNRAAGLAAAMRSSNLRGAFSALSKSFRLILQSAMLAAGAFLVLKNELSPGAMIAGSILMGRALTPVELAINQWSVVVKAHSAWQALSRDEYFVSKTVSRIKREKPTAHIVVKNLGIIPPGQTKPTLVGIDFALDPGEVLGVIGKSGSGKSTLARALVGVWQPTIGEIRLDDESLYNYDPEQLGKYLGYLPQSVTLFHGTVAQNIARMALNPDEESVTEAVKMAHAISLVKHLPESYDTVIHNGTGGLSGGQIRRLGFARAIYGSPVLVILDEPSAGLDMEGTQALNQAIRQMKEQKITVIIMTHRPLAISECDKLLYLENGRQQAYGPRDQILKSIVKNTNDAIQVVRQGNHYG